MFIESKEIATKKLFTYIYGLFLVVMIFLPFLFYVKDGIMESDKYTFTYECELTDKDIYYMFQRLILPTIISTRYKPYEEYWNDYKRLLAIFTRWIDVYYNNKDLTLIKADVIDEADTLIADLKFNCLKIETRHIEEIDIWYQEFLVIWKRAHLFN